MKWISLFENFNQGTRKFYHLTSKDQLPSLFKGIRKDMAGKWEQGAGFYVTTDLVYTESIEGVGSRIGEAIVEIEAPLNSANFDLDFEMNSNLKDAINKFLPQIKMRFVKTMKIDNFLILFNQKPNISFRRLKIRDAEVKVPESESRDWCYICIGSSGNLELEHNIEGALVTRHMFQKFPSDIQEAIRTEIFDAESPGALRYIGPMIKPTRYKIKEAGSWSDWKDISEFYLESIQHGYKSRLANIEDYPSIKKICNQNREWLPFVMRVAIEESINRNEVIVAEDSGKVIGFIHFHKRRDGVTTLHEIAVDKEYQGLGIARELISKLEKPIRLKVVKENPANEFYKKLGFEWIGLELGKTRELNVYQLV